MSASLAASRPFDAGAFEAVNRFARSTPALHGLVRGYAGDGIVVLAVLLLVGWWRSRARSPEAVATALWAGAAGLVALGLNQPLVAFFHEARPYTALPGILVLADRSTDPSFPSDHATVAGAVAVGLWLVDRRLGLVAGVAGVLLALARVYTAAHYPHDIVAGLLFGGAVAAVGWLVVRRPLVAVVTRLGPTPVGRLVGGRPEPAAT